ncbi:MAG: hypothetical protein QF442_03480, partial [Candidatus Peribacteraceae bacterium]|nr:hypothetical protein [Candidatus Peribacteraceae bacterium]
TDSELALCNLAVRIPSSSLFPSLNLSHAVQIVCYAIYREITHAASSARIGKPDTAEQLDAAPALLSNGYSPITHFPRVEFGVFLNYSPCLL